MRTQEEINRLEAKLQAIQDEIDRRHERIDQDVERAHNMEKIDELRRQKNEINEQLAALRA